MPNIIGQILLNQYRVDTFIATGGMGAVYRVWDLKRNTPLAMKVLHRDLAEDPHILKRFQREANALRKLAHPNIVQFYGFFQTPDYFFLLEKFVDGPSLKDVLRLQVGAPLPLHEVLIYIKGLTAALGYAHANGVIHCDVKPGNVLIDRAGSIYLTDFGIARHADSTTTTIANAGTVAYMAPEQIRSESVIPATDIYSLAVMLFEMLTGQRPFRGNEPGLEKGGETTYERIRYAHLHLQPPDPRQLNSSIPIELAKTILRALDKAPARRYQTMQDFKTAVYTSSGLSQEQLDARVSLPAVYRKDDVGSQAHNVPLQVNRSGKFKKISPFLAGTIALVTISYLLSALGNEMSSNNPDNSLIETSIDNLTMGSTALQNFNPTSFSLPTETPPPSTTPIQFEINPKDSASVVRISAGEFIMGSDPDNDPYFLGAEGPSHKVYVDEFSIYRTEVTNGMYQKCVAEKACPKPDQNRSRTHSNYYGNSEFDDYPVINVSWISAQSYCKWAGGRLPTEAEWEKAARGEDGRLFPWGNDPPHDGQINMCDSYCADSVNRTGYQDDYPDIAPVGVHPGSESPYGVLDMSGNVWEWVFDWKTDGYPKNYEYNNPKGPVSGSARVLRGGSWRNTASEVRTVVRISLTPARSLDTVGFRCVIAP